MRVLVFLVMVGALCVHSTSLAPWEMQSLLQISAQVYEPCGDTHCAGSHPIPRGYECNCEKLDEHPLCACAKVNNADAHPGYVITSEHPLPSNAGAKVGDIVLPPDDDRAKEFEPAKSGPAEISPPSDGECIPNVAEVTPGTCVVGNNPNPPVSSAAVAPPAPAAPAPVAPPASAPVAPAASAAAAPTPAAPSSPEAVNTEQKQDNPAPSVSATDKVATAAVVATAKESLQAIEKANADLKSNQAVEVKKAKELKKAEKEVKAEAKKVRAQKIDELAVEKKVVGEKQGLIIQREALKGVEQRLRELNEQVRKTLQEASKVQLPKQTAEKVAALTSSVNQQQAEAQKVISQKQ